VLGVPPAAAVEGASAAKRERVAAGVAAVEAEALVFSPRRGMEDREEEVEPAAAVVVARRELLALAAARVAPPSRSSPKVASYSLGESQFGALTRVVQETTRPIRKAAARVQPAARVSRANRPA
jgi:hypothetical protein